MTTAHPELTPATCRAMRAWLGWHQSELAKAADLSNSSISTYERGGRSGWILGDAGRRAILLAFQRAGVKVQMINGEIRGIKFIEVAASPITPD